MNWTPIEKLKPHAGMIKVKDEHGQEAFACCNGDGILEIVTDSNELPLMDKLTEYRLLKECTFSLFNATPTSNF